MNNIIIPSIDIMGGKVVQLIGGKERVLEVDNAFEVAEKFWRIGEIAVIDLDAAMGQGSNAELIEALVKRGPCRVGGGIRSVESAQRWLQMGARKVILGTRAVPEVLRELPKERTIAALDGVNGEVVVHGWTSRTGESVIVQMKRLQQYVSGFLVTFVEREGRMEGIDFSQVDALRTAAGACRLTVAGGVTTVEDIARLAKQRVEAQVGMAIYTGRLGLADGIWAQVRSERSDGLVPTAICDRRGFSLGLAWSSLESLRTAIEKGAGAYHSRSRGLWIKGESSGNRQQLLRVEIDCDGDALRFVVEQLGAGFCHLDTTTCWGDDWGLSALEKRLQQRKNTASSESYSRRLFEDPSLLEAKIREEAEELCEASTHPELIHEAADILYFTMVRLVKAGIPWHKIENELDRRSWTIKRSGGERKDGM